MFTHRATTAGAVLLIGLIAGQSARADKFETFDSAESAAANGWSASGSGGGGGTAGWVGTNLAGGAAPGEAQFDPNRGPALSYLDTNLGMTINGSIPWNFSGTIAWIGNGDFQDADTGTAPVIGFSSDDNNYVGFVLRADGTYPSWQVRYVKGGEIQFVEGGNDNHLLPFETPTTFSMGYNPNEGEFGTLKVSFSLNFFGQVPPEIVWALNAEQRLSLEAEAYTRAGFFKVGNGIDNSGMELRLDDLTYTGVGASADLPGDFNGNNVVDAADYTVWRDNLGASDESSLNGNGDGLGGVDALDYAYWKSNFGNSGSGAGTFAGGAVPEPATWLLLVLAGAAVGMRRRHSR
jgi:hypothetical protein